MRTAAMDAPYNVGLLAAIVIVLSGVALPGRVRGAINLDLRPRQPFVVVGDTIEVDLYAVSDDPNSDQGLSGTQVILQWNPQQLQLIGHAVPDSGDWILSGFFDDSQIDGLNNSLDDGDAYYQAAASLPGPLSVTPAGLLVTTLSFQALGANDNVQLAILADAGVFTESMVYGAVPGVTVTGALGAANFMVTRDSVWGLLRIQEEQGTPCVRAGETVTILLDAVNLLEPVIAVQALLQYDTDALAFIDVLTGDGAGSPWDVATAIQSDIPSGKAILVVLFGDAASQDATVARVRFVALEDITPPTARLQILPEIAPLSSTLTVASTGMSIVPSLEGPAILASVGDADVDGDIDLSDFGVYFGCVGGPDVAAFTGCECSDFDQDGDVDLLDFAELQVRLTGAL